MGAPQTSPRPQAVTVTFAPAQQRIAVPAGATLLQAAQRAGVEIVATCGARGRCRSCRVQITAGTPPPATLADRVQLGDDAVQDRYRLACQAEAWTDLTVLVAPPLEEAGFQIMTATAAVRTAPGLVLDAGVVKTYVVPSPPDDETRPSSDLEELARALADAAGGALTGAGARDDAVALDALRRLPVLLRTARDGLTVVRAGDVLLAVEPGDTRAEAFGLAFDIGTTTVVAYLVDLWSGAAVATVSGLNPQAAFGGDLMSRIAFAQEHPAHVRRLHVRLLQHLNAQIEDTCREAAIARERIYKVVVVGNTVMHHLFLGLDPTYVGQAPYAPAVRRGLRLRAHEVGLRLPPATPVFLLPLVAGFVGADATAMALATRLDAAPSPRLAVDIGTNGEMVLGGPDGLVACSAPAGPALEGAQLRCGMRAARGAIDRVRVTPEIAYHVIGDVPPAGLCGSGILDLVAGLLDAGVVDASGRLHPEPPPGVPDALRRRVTVLPDGLPAFVVATADESATGEAVVLTQADIRQVQLAKGAIRAGIAMLQRLTETPDDRLAELLLAGGFGNYLNIDSAMRIGLIPRLARERVHYVGNAAGLGAQMALVSETERRRAEALAQRIRHVPLATRPEFQEVFLEALQFR